jgi:hypothetical protein
MPSETHQVIPDIDADTVIALVHVLLDPPDEDDSSIVTLADLGIDEGGALDLWQAVCEEFGERTLGSEIDPDLLDPTMTVEAAAPGAGGGPPPPLWGWPKRG